MATFEVGKMAKILRNFADVSNSVLLTEGRTQRTIASGKSVLAIAELPEAWPRETGIFDLGKFLSTLSLFDSPKLQFNDDAMSIASGTSRVKYRYSDPSTIQTVTEREVSKLTKENPAVEFTLPEAVLATLKKMTALLDLADVTIEVGEEIVVRATDAKNPGSHAFEHVIADAKRYNPTYSRTLTFKKEHIDMLLGGTYTVLLANWKWVYFSHQSEPINYFIVAKA